MRRLIQNTVVPWFGSLVVVAVLGVELRAQNETGAASPSVGEGHEGVLVLQDGGVLAGHIARADDRYVVTRAGSEMQVSAVNVMLACRSLDEAYRQRREQLTRPTAAAHLSLAEWCLRHDLLSPAAQELTAARGLEPEHPRLALLERRLARASAPRKEQAPSPSAATKRPTDHDAAQASTLAIDVPHDVVERFTRKVQPVLVNNCTTAGCHQPGGSQQFQFDRALLRGVANRRSTMRNLAATLAVVDREHPELSPLLTVPRRTHGGMDGPIFGPRQEQAFQHLVDWVALVTQPGPSEQVVPAASEEAATPATEVPLSPRLVSPIMRVYQPVVETGAANVPGARDAEQGAASKADANTSADVSQANYDQAERPLRPKQPLRYGAQLQSWNPRDPFDPEIFNRERLRQTQRVSAAANGGGKEKR